MTQTKRYEKKRYKARLVTVTLLVSAALVMCAAPGVSQEAPGGVIESERETFRLVEVTRGLSHPWSIAFLPDGTALVTERPGRLQRLHADGSTEQISGLPQIAAGGQGGLLDVALDPDYDQNGWIYFTYSTPYDGGSGTTVGRARLSGSSLQDFEELFRMDAPGSGRLHFGSRMAFLPDGTLVFSIGDRGQMQRAQDPMDHAGALLRINRDGSIPQDNPFVGDANARDELYTLGNRNPQGLAVHPQTGVLWQTEHGPRGGDELNIIEAGNNYGWPEMSQGVDYRTGQPIGQGTSAPGMTQPVEHWSPAIAPSGMAFYFGEQFPEWEGSLFLGSLVDRHLLRLELDGNNRVAHQERLLDGTIGRIRDVRLGPDGNLWLLTDDSNGGVYRLEPVQQ